MSSENNQILREVQVWNTSLVGAYLLWKFSEGYCQKHPHGAGPVGILHFIALAILTNKDLIRNINNRRLDLQSYIRSFEDDKNSDLLLNIQERIKEKRKYTLDSIDVALAKGLLGWQAENGILYPAKGFTIKRGKNINGVLKKNGEAAEILGGWFAAHDISTIATYLKVVL